MYIRCQNKTVCVFRNDSKPEFDYFFLYNCKKAKSSHLAPIIVKILMARGSGHKIETESGTMLTENPNLSAPKN
jgi:hypothetical protein